MDSLVLPADVPAYPSDGETYGTVYLNGLPYPVETEDFQQLATLLGKVSFGEFTADSDMLISSKIYTSFTGGGQVEEASEGADDGRYWWGSLNTAYPKQIALPDEVIEVAGAGYCLGELNGTTYFVDPADKKLYAWNESTLSKGSVIATLTSDPVYRGYEWNGKLWIPQSVGFQSFDGSSAAVQNTTVKAVCFCEWDDKLYCVTSDHKIYSTLDGTTWTLRYTFQSSINAIRLKKYFDASREDTLYITSNKGLYAWDDLTGRLVATRLSGIEAFPPHPDNGLGAEMWKTGEDFFVTVGLDILRWNGDVVSPIQSGLNRDEGLPQQYRGKIVDLAPGHKYMYALVQGTSEVVPYEATTEMDPGQNDEGEFESVTTDPSNIVMGWNGVGWHPIHVPAASGVCRWMVMTGNGGTTRVWWGIGDNAYSVKISRPFLNPRMRILAGESRHQLTGELITSRFDAGKRMFDKVLSHSELTMRRFVPGAMEVEVAMKTDAHDFVTIGFATASSGTQEEGLDVFPYNIEHMPDGTYFSRGEVMRWAQWRFRLRTYDPIDSPIMFAFATKYITRPLQTSTYTLRIALQFAHKFDRGAQQMLDELNALSTAGGFVRLQHNALSEGERSRRVYVSRQTGQNSTGFVSGAYRSLSIVEIPITLGGFNGNTSDPPVYSAADAALVEVAAGEEEEIVE